MSFERQRTPMERIYYTIALVVGIIFLFSLVGQTINITTKVPATAIVYVDEQNQVYYAPPYILGNKYPPTLDADILKAHTLADSEKNNYKPDRNCVELGYFKEQDTLTHTVLAKLGLANPKPSRWNPDGSWNW